MISVDSEGTVASASVPDGVGLSADSIRLSRGVAGAAPLNSGTQPQIEAPHDAAGQLTPGGLRYAFFEGYGNPPVELVELPMAPPLPSCARPPSRASGALEHGRVESWYSPEERAQYDQQHHTQCDVPILEMTLR